MELPLLTPSNTLQHVPSLTLTHVTPADNDWQCPDCTSRNVTEPWNCVFCNAERPPNPPQSPSHIPNNDYEALDSDSDTRTSGDLTSNTPNSDSDNSTLRPLPNSPYVPNSAHPTQHHPIPCAALSAQLHRLFPLIIGLPEGEVPTNAIPSSAKVFQEVGTYPRKGFKRPIMLLLEAEPVLSEGKDGVDIDPTYETPNAIYGIICSPPTSPQLHPRTHQFDGSETQIFRLQAPNLEVCEPSRPARVLAFTSAPGSPPIPLSFTHLHPYVGIPLVGSCGSIRAGLIGDMLVSLDLTTGLTKGTLSWTSTLDLPGSAAENGKDEFNVVIGSIEFWEFESLKQDEGDRDGAKKENENGKKDSIGGKVLKATRAAGTAFMKAVNETHAEREERLKREIDEEQQKLEKLTEEWMQRLKRKREEEKRLREAGVYRTTLGPITYYP